MSRKPQFDLLAIGDATWDAIVTDSNGAILKQRGKKYLAYEYGEKVHLDNAYFSYGGGAANVSVGAARLGVRAAYCGSIGTDRVGKDILAHFKDEKVNTSLAVSDKKHVSALGVVLTAPDGERTILLYDGSNRDLADAKLPTSKLFDTKWLYLPSLPGKSGKLYNRLATEASKRGVKVALNPGMYQIAQGTKGLHAALSRSDILSLNEDEARALLVGRGHSVKSVPAMLRKLHDITDGIIVITRGNRGAAATDGEHVYTLKASGSRRVNTVGAGDAFNSALVVALLKGKALPEAMVVASLNASSVVADYTAQDGLQTWNVLLSAARRSPRYQPTVIKLPKR